MQEMPEEERASISYTDVLELHLLNLDFMS